MHTTPLALLLAAVLLATPASAQNRDKGAERDRDRDRKSQNVPPGHLPPPGKCRVWFDSRPPGQQSAPTSCAVARAEAARTGGRVVHGGDDRKRNDDVRRDDRKRKDDDRRDDRKRKDDDRRDDRKRDGDDRRECDAKDRAKGECGSRDGNRDRDRDDRDDDDDRDDRDRDRNDSDRARDRNRDCVDRNRDGRCDYDAGEYPTTLPEMVWGVILGRGQSLEGARRWVGAEAVRVRYIDTDRNGVPELVSLYRAGQIIQQWADSDRDGRADRVSIYRNGSVVRVIP